MSTTRRMLGLWLALAAGSLSVHWPGETPGTATRAPELSPESAELLRIQQGLRARRLRLRTIDVPRVALAIQAESRRAHFSPDLVLAVIEVESGGNAFARSRAGALGLMQLLPATGRAEARRHGLHWRGPETLYDPVANVRLGVRYLERLIERFGSVELALAAYNWGPTEIAARLKGGQPVPRRYADTVLGAYRRPHRSPTCA